MCSARRGEPVLIFREKWAVPPISASRTNILIKAPTNTNTEAPVDNFTISHACHTDSIIGGQDERVIGTLDEVLCLSHTVFHLKIVPPGFWKNGKARTL
jgi:hypothetical protein